MNTRNLNSGAFELMHPNAAGIDIAGQMHLRAHRISTTLSFKSEGLECE